MFVFFYMCALVIFNIVDITLSESICYQVHLRGPFGFNLITHVTPFKEPIHGMKDVLFSGSNVGGSGANLPGCFTNKQLIFEIAKFKGTIVSRSPWLTSRD